MQAIAADTVIDMVDHQELLFSYRDYVAECVARTSASQNRPLSFDDWYRTHFFVQIETQTTVIEVVLTWECAAHGHLCGSDSRTCLIRIPSNMLTESGEVADQIGLKRIAEKLADKMNCRLPTVAYRGSYIYCWTWN